MKRPVVNPTKPHKESHQDHRLRTASSISYRRELKYFYCRQIFTLGPDVILNTGIYKKFGSHNGSLTLSMHHSENTKIKLITIIKQRRVLLANPTNTAIQSKKTTSWTTAGQAEDIASGHNPRCESFMKRPSLSLRPEPPSCMIGLTTRHAVCRIISRLHKVYPILL